MWQVPWLIAGTALGVTTLTVVVLYRSKKLSFNHVLWRVLVALSGISAANFAVVATLTNNSWWLIPGALFFMTFFLVVGGLANSAKTEYQKLIAQTGEAETRLTHLTALLGEPKVVDYSRFILQYGRHLSHSREDGNFCDIPIDSSTMRLSEFIEVANAHECASSDAIVVMRRVA